MGHYRPCKPVNGSLSENFVYLKPSRKLGRPHLQNIIGKQQDLPASFFYLQNKGTHPILLSCSLIDSQGKTCALQAGHIGAVTWKLRMLRPSRGHRTCWESHGHCNSTCSGGLCTTTMTRLCRTPIHQFMKIIHIIAKYTNWVCSNFQETQVGIPHCSVPVVAPRLSQRLQVPPSSSSTATKHAVLVATTSAQCVSLCQCQC
ncbi:hypothetical protein COO60DRAFT_1241168 [Scenedesmus sp. NREL 46B-D3]|nr:hypothetical protein COO60DRAFT_1241168 [Scenedesmus sp. NREL 46B-D3]